MTAKNRPNYRLRTLGGLSIAADGALDADVVVQRKGLALLALLATAGDRGLTRDKIFGYLWADSDASRASNALSQLLFRLRRDLGADCITGNGELRIGPVIANDVSEFERLIAAGALEDAARIYTGSFLDGFYLKDAPEFERWVDDHRQRLAVAFGTLLEDLATAASRSNRHADAARWWQRRAALDPLSSRVARLYMEALASAGDPAAALRHADLHAVLLRSELGTGPDQALLEYAARLRTAVPASSVERATGDSSAPVVGSDLEPLRGPTPSTQARRFSYWHAGMIAVLSCTAIWVAVTSLAAANTREGHLVVAPFANLTGDSTLDAFSAVLTHSTSKLVAGTGRVTLDSDAGGNSELLVEASIRRDQDRLVVVPSLTRRGSRGRRWQLGPIERHVADRDSLIEHVAQQITGAVAALSDPRMLELTYASTLPRYDAFLAYLKGVEDDINGFPPTSHWLQAARLDTNFAAPRLRLLDVAPAAARDSFVDWLERRRARLSRSDQLLLDAVRAEATQPIDRYFDAALRLRAQARDNPAALQRVAHAGLKSRRFQVTIDALHDLRRGAGWQRDTYETWQMDIEAHHQLDDLNSAVTEWLEWSAKPGIHLQTACVVGVRQFAALGRGAAIDSLVEDCAARDVQANMTRLGRRTQLAPELYRWAGRELLWHGHRAEGERVLRRSYAIEREMHASDSTAANGWLSMQLLGDWPLAYSLMKAELGMAGPCQPRDRRQLCGLRGRTRLAVTAARAGDTAVAVETLAWIASQRHPDSSYKIDRAKIELALGQTDQAIRSLREAAVTVSPINLLHNATDLLDLRDDRRFRALVLPRR